MYPKEYELVMHFYPRPPRGGRRSSASPTSSSTSYFYPRPPRGGRPDYTGKSTAEVQFLSPPSARRATALQKLKTIVEVISIPALREEGDDKIVAEPFDEW